MHLSRRMVDRAKPIYSVAIDDGFLVCKFWNSNSILLHFEIPLMGRENTLQYLSLYMSHIKFESELHFRKKIENLFLLGSITLVANINQVLTITRARLEYRAQVIRETAPLGRPGHLLRKATRCYVRPPGQDWEILQIYAIHRNGHRDIDKMRKQRKMSQIKEQEKIPEKGLKET